MLSRDSLDLSGNLERCKVVAQVDRSDLNSRKNGPLLISGAGAESCVPTLCPLLKVWHIRRTNNWEQRRKRCSICKSQFVLAVEEPSRTAVTNRNASSEKERQQGNTGQYLQQQGSS